MSNIRIISTKELIPRIYDEYNIQHSDWEMKAPQYFLYALQDMQMSCVVEDSIAIDYTDYRCELPADIRLVDRIEYNNTKLDINSNIRNISSGKNGFNYFNEFHINNNWIHFESESGCVTIYYRKPNLEFDCELNVYFPTIQDIEAIKQALMAYVVKTLIGRGYKHQTYNLTDNNEFTNIGMIYEKYRKSAKSKYNPISTEDRTETYRILTTMLSNPENKTDILYTN